MTAIVYRSKPTTIEAIQWLGNSEANVDACFAFAVHNAINKVDLDFDNCLSLLAGKDGAQKWVPVPVGHWLVSQPGDRSDIWPVDPGYFAVRYEPVTGESKGA